MRFHKCVKMFKFHNKSLLLLRPQQSQIVGTPFFSMSTNCKSDHSAEKSKTRAEMLNWNVSHQKGDEPRRPLWLLLLVETPNRGMLKPCLTVMSTESYPHLCAHVCARACTRAHRGVLTSMSELRDQGGPPQ